MNKSNAVYVRGTKEKINLKKIETSAPDWADKNEIASITRELGDRMEQLFDLMFFAGQNSLLIVLQGMDAAGKDGTIRHLLKHCHAQSARVASFKVPSADELAHDFLWRCHKETPANGEICIFNRSHYEDVGVVRVHNLVEESTWQKRYGHINNFEDNLIDAGTIILKVFLHISKDEQMERFIERENDPEAAWKLSVGDWKERKHWDGYQEAYSDAICRCASEGAPWLVVPADRKWWRNFVVTEAVVGMLEGYESAWRDRLEMIGAKAKSELATFKSQEKQL